MLYKQYYFLNGNKMLLILLATCVIIAGFHTFVHLVNFSHLDGRSFQTQFHLDTFLIMLVAACLLWCGHAFPELRVKERRMHYLITPTTALERFVFEILNRVIIFIIVFPLLYWILTNLVTGTFHLLSEGYDNYLFTYEKILPNKLSNLESSLVYSVGFFILIIPFAGASHFQKLPLVKTILLSSLVIAVYAGYIWFVVEGLDLHEYRPKNDRILFMSDDDHAKLFGMICAWTGSIALLLFSYFKLKEKEV